MVKRLFAILIAATMLSISIPTSVFAEEINDNGQPVTTDDEDEDNEDLIDQIVEEGLAKQAAGLEEAQTPMCEITFVDSLDSLKVSV